MIDIDVSKIVSEIGEPKARLIENEDEKRQRKIMLISSIVFLFLFLCGSLFFWILKNRSASQLSILDNQVATLTKSNQTLLDYEMQANVIVDRNNSIETILNNKANWSYVLTKLEKVIPVDIVFMRFEVASQDNMRISGISPDYVELSKLIVSMKDSRNDMTMPMDPKTNPSYFDNVELTTASIATVNKNSMVSFAISFGAIKQAVIDSAKQVVSPVIDNTTKLKTPQLPTSNNESTSNTTPTLPGTNPSTPTTSSPATNPSPAKQNYGNENNAAPAPVAPTPNTAPTENTNIPVL